MEGGIPVKQVSLGGTHAVIDMSEAPGTLIQPYAHLYSAKLNQFIVLPRCSWEK